MIINYLAAPDSLWCGGVGGSSLGERLGRVEHFSASRQGGPLISFREVVVRELWDVCIKDNQGGDLTENQYGFVDLIYISVHVGHAY